GPVGQVRVTSREADVEQSLRVGGYLVAALVAGADAGEAHGGTPDLLGRDGIPGQQAGYRTLQFDQGVVAEPLVGGVGGPADREQPYDQHALGLVDDAQSARLTDEDEPPPYPVIELRSEERRVGTECRCRAPQYD